MRCLLVTETFPCTSQTFVSAQAAGLARRGHRVDVLAEYRPGPREPVHPEVLASGLLDRTFYVDLPPEAEAGLTAWPPWAVTWPPGSPTPVRNVRRWLSALPAVARVGLTSPSSAVSCLDARAHGFPAASLAMLYRAGSAARWSGEVDVVHSHFGPVASNYAFVPELLHAPLVVTFHGYDFSEWPREHGSDVYSALFRTASAVTVNSEHARRRVAALGCPPSLLHRLNVGIDLTGHPFRPRVARPGEDVRLVTVARLVEKKGHAVALEAVARMRAATGLALRYDVVGDGPDRPLLEAWAAELGLGDAVTFHGALASDAVARLLDAAHVFVLASTTASNGDEEGTPVALMEAQARGLPVVSTFHSGIPEVVLHGRSGRLAREGDALALARELQAVVLDPQAWPGMGAAGRAHIEERYDADRLLRQLEDIYEGVASEHRATRHVRRPVLLGGAR